MVLPVNRNMQSIEKISLCLLLLLFTLLSACQATAAPSIDTSSSQNSTTDIRTEPIRLAQLREKLANKETFYAYIGRPTCPHCRKFEPKLQEAIKRTQVPVFYLNTDEEDSAEASHFVDSQGITTVPHLTYYKEGETGAYLKKGSEATVGEIEIFLKTGT